MALRPDAAEAPPSELSQSRSPRARRMAVQIAGAEHEMLQTVVRKHIIRKRWYALLNIIFLRLRQQKMGA